MIQKFIMKTIQELLTVRHRKICSKCGESKILTEFHRNKRSKDGFNRHCKTCVREYRQELKSRKNKVITTYYTYEIPTPMPAIHTIPEASGMPPEGIIGGEILSEIGGMLPTGIDTNGLGTEIAIETVSAVTGLPFLGLLAKIAGRLE